jgi:hypothetical protein
MRVASPARNAALVRAACRLALGVCCALVLALPAASPAFAAGSWWGVYSEVVPTNLPPGGKGTVMLVLANLGSLPIEGAKNAVKITDTLPSELTAIKVNTTASGPTCAIGKSSGQVECTYTHSLQPYGQTDLEIQVQVAPGAAGVLEGNVRVEGGGVGPIERAQRLLVSEAPTRFGAQDYSFALEGENGEPATDAGSHPFQMTSTLVTNQEPGSGGNGNRRPVEDPKDLHFELPAGLVGDPEAVEHCSVVNFDAVLLGGPDLCQPGAVVGVATVTVREPALLGIFTKTVPVFSLEPSYGEPARFGFEVLGLVFVTLDVSLDAEHEYRVVTNVERANQTAGLLSSQVTIWGVPGAESHNAARGWECVAGGAYAQTYGHTCPASSVQAPKPLLISPTACATDPADEPLDFPAAIDSWDAPSTVISLPSAIFSGALGEPLGMQGCEALPFSPSLEAAAEAHSAAAPTGLAIRVHLPQTSTLSEDPQALAEADVKDTTITLPEGVQLDPSAANGLQACSEQQIGYRGMGENGAQHFTDAEPSCPGAAKVALVHIKTPLLPRELEGALYLATPAPNGAGEPGHNPFDSLVALYLVAEDKQAGVLVKLAGKGELNEVTGQVTTSFQNTPQLPFEELRVELFGGEHASLSTPPRCGSYANEATFTPWSGTGPVSVSSPTGEFVVSEDCSSGAVPFTPGFSAQSVSTQAGAFTPFELEIVRPDAQQALSGLTVHLPSGVAALLSSLTPCQEPPAGQEWACGPESLIGHSTAWSGLGKEPAVLGGNAYLTTGYDGAPFGILDATEAKAGPFDLGMVDVRSRIDVNPETAAVTITTDPGPRGEALITMLKGIPVQLKRLLVSVDRPDFEFNPTSCDPTSITGVLDGSEGAAAAVSSRFQVGGCGSLPFHPVLTATVDGHANKPDGTGFDVKITSQGLGVANIKKVDLQLPEPLPSRQSTLTKACLSAVFQANPAGCSEESVIGYATVYTPVLKQPLVGPAYLVSHGGEAFPDVEFVLQGEGIKLILDGKTYIHAGITYSKFETAPDAPFTTFETNLPAGPHSILTAHASADEPYDLCGSKLMMPTTITAQDGAVIEQDTPITPTGCGGVLAAKVKLTPAQLLAKALKACRSKYKKSKRKRLVCEKQARQRYSAKKAHKAPSKATHTQANHRA